MKKKIPVTAVKEFGNKVDYDHVIVLAYDSKTNTECVTTWGKDAAQCEAAAYTGNEIKKALGWPAKLCNAKPARQISREKIQERYNVLKDYLLFLYATVSYGSDIRKYPDIVTKLLAIPKIIEKASKP